MTTSRPPEQSPLVARKLDYDSDTPTTDKSKVDLTIVDITKRAVPKDLAQRDTENHASAIAPAQTRTCLKMLI